MGDGQADEAMLISLTSPFFYFTVETEWNGSNLFFCMIFGGAGKVGE
ncbi:hypothetical protein J2S09_001303 [Bacillus fengqiuensis]|nr:hypothetical protein [Bacillus fengqiuensis]